MSQDLYDINMLFTVSSQTISISFYICLSSFPLYFQTTSSLFFKLLPKLSVLDTIWFLNSLSNGPIAQNAASSLEDSSWERRLLGTLVSCIDLSRIALCTPLLFNNFCKLRPFEQIESKVALLAVASDEK